MAALLAFGIALFAPRALPAAVPEEGFEPLFNGKNLDGWIQHGGRAKYAVEGNEIVGTSVPNTGNSFLCTRRDYSNFILELQFKVQNKLNSGVQIRSQCFDEPKTVHFGKKKIQIAAGRVHGYQVEIDPSRGPGRGASTMKDAVAGWPT